MAMMDANDDLFGEFEEEELLPTCAWLSPSTPTPSLRQHEQKLTLLALQDQLHQFQKRLGTMHGLHDDRLRRLVTLLSGAYDYCDVMLNVDRADLMAG